MKAELARRHGYTAHVLALFAARPNAWIGWKELAHAGGELAWRTRCADCRRIVRRDGGRIIWNKDVKASAYMYIPFQSLGRPAHEYRESNLFDSEGPYKC